MKQNELQKKKLNNEKIGLFNEHGITLIALVVTIIIMLILAGVTLNIALGDNGLINHIINSINESKRAEYQDILTVIKTGVDMKALSENLSDEEYLQELKNEINKEIEDGNLKGSTLSEEGDKLRVITKEGFVFDITKDNITYVGQQGKHDKDLPEIKDEDIEISLSEETWTKGPITVTITPKISIENFTLQYSTDEITWQKYTAPFEINENGTIYARVVNGLSEYKGEATKEITIIDTLEPSSVDFTIKHTTHSITVIANGEDNEETEKCGSSGILKYYFSIDGGDWLPETGQNATQENGNEYTFNDLVPNKEYNIQVKAEDAATNVGYSESKKEKVMTADGSFDNEGKVNTPKLGSGMTAVTWSEEKQDWVEANSEDEWYDYSNKKWANAKTSDGSMWVWIPRFAYQIETGYHTNSATGGKINIKFLQGTSNTAADGTNSWANSSGAKNWNIHPAFRSGSSNNYANGEWKNEIPGIWIAKFAASSKEGNSGSLEGDDTTNKTLQLKPGQSMWRYITIGNIYTVCKDYDTKVLNNASYNSHLIKNSEYGAMCYLTQSIGANVSGIEISTETGTTGGGSGSNYANNVKQSTTGNIYGVYDIKKGVFEFISAYVWGDSLSKELFSLYATSILDDTDNWMKQVYKAGLYNDALDNYNLNKAVYGDAIWETSTHESDSSSWFGQRSIFIYPNAIFFARAGNTGLFHYYEAGATGYSYGTFRPVIIP